MISTRQKLSLGVDPSNAAAASPGAWALEKIAVTLVSPRPHAPQEMKPIVDAAVGANCFFTCASASGAGPVLRSHEIMGRRSGVFLVDLRGQATSEQAGEIKGLRKAYPEASVIVITTKDEVGALAEAIQFLGPLDQVSFLMSPIHHRLASETVRAMATQYLTRVNAAALEQSHADAQAALRRDVEELERRLLVAKHAARHDDLTGALNRTGFIEELTARLLRDRQRQNVMMIDLDRFKAINDTLGHAAGDDLVRKICTGIQGVIPSDAILARLGGDEFGVVVESCSPSRIASICEDILKVCSASRYIFGNEVQVSASIGVAQQGSLHSEFELIRQADLALYAAKREGRNRYRVFDEALDKATQYRLAIEGGLERALRTGNLKMVYQPIVGSRSGGVLGFEALVRWDTFEHGPISPATFIPVAEESGLILDVGDWITRQALRDCKKWGAPYVSINLSVRQFLRHNVGERILRYAAEADVAPSKIQIELTETAIIDDVERAAYHLKVMRDAGVRVALDDFGTGYSSLVYLKQFDIDCIKIDKSFVDNITRDRQSSVIVASVSKLACSLGMSVVAEGVETEAQRKILIAAGCDMLQGYYFSRPMAVADAVTMVDALPNVAD